MGIDLGDCGGRIVVVRIRIALIVVVELFLKFALQRCR